MKTAMQELLKHFIDEWSSPSDFWNPSKVIDKVESMIEKEKEQIIEAGNSCGLKAVLYKDEVEKMSVDELNTEIDKNGMTFGEEYYNQTYNQNK